MMNLLKYIGIVLWSMCLWTSCTKDQMDSYEVEKLYPDADEMLAEFKNTLKQGPSSWQAILNPKSGKTFNMFFKMDTGGHVWTLADFDVNSARQPTLGTYTLTTTSNHAHINFSSGTYLDNVRHQEDIKWEGADTSYAYKYTKGDTIVLLGNRNGDELRLINITAEEAMKFEQGFFGNAYIYMSNFFSQNSFFSFTLPNVGPVQFVIDATSRSLRFFYGKDGRAVFSANDYAYGLNQIVLKYPINIGGIMIKELLVDTKTSTFYIQNGNQRIDLRGDNMPVVPLHLLLGTAFNPYVTLPSPYFVEQLPGWSDKFTELWLDATNQLISNTGLYLGYFSFRMDVERDLMNLEVMIFTEQAIYTAIYPYSYTKTKDGVYHFTELALSPDDAVSANALEIQPYMQPLLEILKTDDFTLDLYPYSTSDGSQNFLAQMFSVNRKDIFFTGYMSPID